MRLKNLPQKVLIVHQFTEGMVKDRDKVLDRPGVAIVHNIDGFGTPDVKKNVYVQLVYHPGAGDGGSGTPGRRALQRLQALLQRGHGPDDARPRRSLSSRRRTSSSMNDYGGLRARPKGWNDCGGLTRPP